MCTSYLFGDLTITDASRGLGEFAHTFGGPPDRDDAYPSCALAYERRPVLTVQTFASNQ